MARPLGAKNKRTLIREARMREASVQAQRQLASISNAARLDSLWVMEEAMSYFYRRAMTESSRSAGNCNQVRDDLLQAVAIAKEIALYRHPRLSAVKVSAIPSGPDWPDTADEMRKVIFRKLREEGFLPADDAAPVSGAEDGVRSEFQ
jgi:hypothetical protein